MKKFFAFVLGVCLILTPTVATFAQTGITPDSVALSQTGWSFTDSNSLQVMGDLSVPGSADAVSLPVNSKMFVVYRASGAACLTWVSEYSRNNGVTFPTVHNVKVWNNCTGSFVWSMAASTMACNGLGITEGASFGHIEMRYKLEVMKSGSTWLANVVDQGGPTLNGCARFAPPGSTITVASHVGDGPYSSGFIGTKFNQSSAWVQGQDVALRNVAVRDGSGVWVRKSSGFTAIASTGVFPTTWSRTDIINALDTVQIINK